MEQKKKKKKRMKQIKGQITGRIREKASIDVYRRITIKTEDPVWDGISGKIQKKLRWQVMESVQHDLKIILD